MLYAKLCDTDDILPYIQSFFQKQDTEIVEQVDEKDDSEETTKKDKAKEENKTNKKEE